MSVGYRSLAVCAGVLLSLGGCATNSVHLPNWFAQEGQSQPAVAPGETAEQDNGLRYTPERRELETQTAGPPVMVYMTPKTVYQPRFTHKPLQDYAEQIAMQLMDSARGLRADSRVGVASFVTLDSSLQHADRLGNQLAEMLMTEVQQFGVPVVDFKMFGGVTVRRDGDFVFTRAPGEVRRRAPMDFVLAGTLVRDEMGVRVNARIMDFTSGASVASTSVFIPRFVVEELAPRAVMVSP
ncbi:hypothetical protein LJ739_10935 [Aestuariibacter halophilus]|uniref:FlgO domain-containing protein n=1 Tax=Fluctibacter halophilus TaxID=226011 RepID=A0ABS8G853_9ALTE|nr:FlgO family outer membrane protein [Aestuariibacter halophilus]MCC2616757.1 hypothetical protein [Aestuariibacter halophilus]